MPVHIKRIAGKFRIVDYSNDKITRLKDGTAVDGGGHESEAEAYKQEQAINKALKKKSAKAKKKGAKFE
ncbi:MAG: hypothetical protein KAS32_28575 [Candidatus Peribacteraceae bacterium]|nr:hypothetical protein [Candidatus Peribacteraceae bacterium]